MHGLVAQPSESHFASLSELAKECEFAPIDVVVMCNVLHEIDPSDWVKTLSIDVPPILLEDGYLLIAEDTLLPHGELAHRKGFLVLDDVGVRKLFNDAKREILKSTAQTRGTAIG